MKIKNSLLSDVVNITMIMSIVSIFLPLVFGWQVLVIIAIMYIFVIVNTVATPLKELRLFKRNDKLKFDGLEGKIETGSFVADKTGMVGIVKNIKKKENSYSCFCTGMEDFIFLKNNHITPSRFATAEEISKFNEVLNKHGLKFDESRLILKKTLWGLFFKEDDFWGDVFGIKFIP